MTRIAVGALAALLLALSVTPLASAATTTFTVNVVWATSLGCSPDFFTSPDLRVRVLVNNVPVLTTLEGSDQTNPSFAATATTTANLPATVSVEVDEGEASGFFGTTYKPCVVGPGGATRADFIYNGEAAWVATARGEGADAAEALIVIGTTPPAAPVATATSSTNSVRLDWTAGASGDATAHRVALGGAGRVLNAAVSGNSATLSGLCDNQEFVLRVIRDSSPWHVSSADVRVTTKNLAPWSPTVLNATRNGNVTWESRSTHDAARYEVHAWSSSSFTPTSSSLRGTIQAGLIPQTRTAATGISFSASDAFVIVRVFDSGGMFADSTPFALGAQEVGGSTAADDCAPPTTSPPSGSTPTPTTAPTPTSAEQQPPPAPKRYGVDMSAAISGTVIAGTAFNVTFTSKWNETQTLELRVNDPSKTGPEQDPTIIALVTLSANETRVVAIAIPHGFRAHGSYNLELEARIRESNLSEGASMRFLFEVPLQAYELASEDLFAIFSVKGAGVALNATPGSVLQIPVTLINKADHALRVETWAAPGLRNDSDIGRVVIAWGLDTALSTSSLTLEAYSKRELTLTITVPLNATIGEDLVAQLGIKVNNTQRETTIPAIWTLHIVAGPPGAEVITSADVGGSGLSTLNVVAITMAVGATTLGVVAWLFTADARRYAFAVALYSRFAKSETLDHPGREALHRSIAAKPGISYSDLRRASGMNTGAIVHHLRFLERGGLIASRKEGAYRRFYPVGHAPTANEVRVSTLSPTQTKVLEVIQSGDFTQGELAERVGLSQQGLSHHVKALERAGHIEAVYDGRVWRYRAVALTDIVRP